ncbi:MAG: transcription-repair coupling factor [Clostridiales bacterium]|jgi:transcription-repair coupling factor (superfamily II helicase)|nr:transcription-repair coupling factor [Clostridiales bacterium]
MPKAELLDIQTIFAGADGLEKLARLNREGKNLSVFGLSGFAKCAAVTLLEGVLVIASDYFSARRFYENVKPLYRNAVLLPAKEDVLTYHQGVYGGSIVGRFSALFEIANGRADVVVTTAQAVLQLYPLRERFLSASLRFVAGASYDLEAAVKGLTAAGYKRCEQVADLGQFSVRGDILEVWSVKEAFPARLEFFGDELEKIKLVDTANQVAAGTPALYEVCPFTDLFLSEEEAGEAAAALYADVPKNLEPDAAARAAEIAGEAGARLSSGDRSAALDIFLPYTRCQSLFGFGGFLNVVYDGTKQVYDSFLALRREHTARFAALLKQGEAFNGAFRQYLAESDLKTTARLTAFQSISNANRLFDPDAAVTYKTMEIVPYTRDIDQLARDIKSWHVTGYHVYIAGGKEINEWMRAVLAERAVGFSNGYEAASGLSVVDAFVENGCIFHDDKRVVIGAYDLTVRPAKKQIKRSRAEVFSELKPGDYVVHEFHGIGLFEKVTRLDMGDIRRDYLEIRYAGADKLYVPVENMEALSRYTAETPPALSKIGGAAFAKVKNRVKSAVKALAVNLFELYGERLEGKGHPYAGDDSLLRDFERTCGFVETDDQLTAVAEGLRDLKTGKIMDRLLCGDVGYGKTEVALRLAFKVIAEGKQAAFLSPTTILARQHFETVKRRMEPFGINAVRLTRFDAPAEQKKAVERLKAGKADIAVGTHRLLSKDVEFADLGLLILDEEQRFGVSDKEKIKDMRRSVNVLTLSATPIPRTLHMSMVGIRDISILDTPPVDRLPVQTYVTEYSETLVADAVGREVARGGQVFIVYNRVAKIDRFAFRLKDLLPDVRLAVAHGQMDERALERVIEGFVGGETDVLVSSTIIENGIDIPRANTMIVVDADRLGLSQLYQLRGRVGRSNLTAYVFFTYEGGKVLTENAVKRLESVMQFTELGSGFKIAMRDLEIRGAGNIMGAEQSGHMEKVGYDMYVRLLREAVAELKGEAVKPQREVKVLTDYSTFIPEAYAGDEKGRVKLYARIARVQSLKERDRLLKDIAEIYGPPPESMKNLVNAALMKNLAAGLDAAAVSLKRGKIAVSFDKLKDIPAAAHKLCLSMGGRLAVETPPALCFDSATVLLKFLLSFAKNSA